MTTINRERIEQLLDYNPASGVFTWKVRGRNMQIGDVAGYLDRYVRIWIDNKPCLAHRLAWLYTHGEIPEGLQIDHINGIRDDNRIENLRCVSRSVNGQNQKRPMSTNKSGFLGVVQRGKKWAAFIKGPDCPKATYLGTFDTPEGAHEAYLGAKRNLHEGNTL